MKYRRSKILATLGLILSVPAGAASEYNIRNSRWLPMGTTTNPPKAMVYVEDGTVRRSGSQGDLWMLAIYIRKDETQLRVLRAHWVFDCPTRVADVVTVEAYPTDLSRMIQRVQVPEAQREHKKVTEGSIGALLTDYACEDGKAIQPIESDPVDYAREAMGIENED